MPLAERIVTERLSVREVETLVKQELRSLNPSDPLKDMFEAKDMSDANLKSIQDTAAALQRKVTTTTTNTTAGTSGNRSSAVSSSIDPDIGSLQTILSQKLKMTVAIKSTGTSGSLVIDFADLQQLDRLIEILSQGQVIFKEKLKKMLAVTLDLIGGLSNRNKNLVLTTKAI